MARCLPIALVVLSVAHLPREAQGGGIVVFRLDPLGVQSEIVGRLDGLLRMELGRLVAEAMPSPREIAQLVQGSPELRECTGEVSCLVTAGRNLKVDQIISGNVGGLAGSYVLNVKMVDVARGEEVRRIQETISGRPDELIEAVRVAAYRLVAPERLRGALEVLANVSGAEVVLDGESLGKTPLPPRHGLAVGEHTLRVHKTGYTDSVQTVKIRLQKTARMVVTLQAPPRRAGRPAKPQAVIPWYTRWWFWTAVGVAAAGFGAALGYALSSRPVVNCSTEPARCGL